MKRSDIKPGTTSTNGKDSLRRVIGDADSRSSRQADDDEVQYEVLRGRGQGRTFSCTRAAFARWARGIATGRVTEEGREP